MNLAIGAQGLCWLGWVLVLAEEGVSGETGGSHPCKTRERVGLGRAATPPRTFRLQLGWVWYS